MAGLQDGDSVQDDSATIAMGTGTSSVTTDTIRGVPKGFVCWFMIPSSFSYNYFKPQWNCTYVHQLNYLTMGPHIVGAMNPQAQQTIGEASISACHLWILVQLEVEI